MDALNELIPALVAARKDFGKIVKDRTAKIATRGGGLFEYRYADLASVIEGLVPILAEHQVFCSQSAGVFLAGTPPAVQLTTRLYHVSGQSLSVDVAMPIADATDARSVGSAITYARRYGLGLACGISPEDDDDGEAARGHDGEQETKAGQPAKACPACGNVGSFLKSRTEPGWFCWKKRGGCGAKWGDGDDLTQPPSTDFMPKEKAKPSERVPPVDLLQEEVLIDLDEAPPAVEATPTTFQVQKKGADGTFTDETVTTQGMDEFQYLASQALVAKLSKLPGKRGRSKALLADVLGVETMDETCTPRNLTSRQAERWITLMQEAMKA